jgi:hypothetical protein
MRMTSTQVFPIGGWKLPRVKALIAAMKATPSAISFISVSIQASVGHWEKCYFFGVRFVAILANFFVDIFTYILSIGERFEILPEYLYDVDV